MHGTILAKHEPAPIELPCSERFYLENENDQVYQIDLSWPLHWREGRFSDGGSKPIIYIVDGNALFMTATESAWRRAASSHFSGGGIIVAIGYPLQGKLYDSKRRSYDLTPPTKDEVPGFGGADEFLDFIEQRVRPAVHARFPNLSVEREALFGHSYGGLFALHTLFTRRSTFDCYIASSPSIWWHDRCILDEAKAFLNDKVSPSDAAADLVKKAPAPPLMLSWGSLEQHPRRWDDESLEHYEGRKKVARDLRMADNTLDLYDMLHDSKRCVLLKAEYEDEEHTSVMSSSVTRALIHFFEDWPLHE